MRFLSKNIELYNVGQWMRRVGVRMMGLVVALFASNRAHALTYSIQTACPTCYHFGGAICGTGINEIIAYSSDAASGFSSHSCIEESNDGTQVRFADSDSGCFNLLRSWGMCSEGNGSHYFLRNYDLNCSEISEYQGYEITYGSSVYSYNRADSGYVEFQIQSGSSSNQYVCCLETGIAVGTGVCCVSSSTCLDDQIHGMCRGSYNTVDINETGNGGAAGCTDYFEDYFSSDLSTGWCDAYGNIYVEGTGALFIAEACWGDRAINGAHMYVQCGVVITSCKTSNGYYSTNKSPSPLTFYSDGGVSAYCKACPAPVSGYDSGHNFSINGGTGTGVESCYATAGTATISLTDTKGTYEETITAKCPYTE